MTIIDTLHAARHSELQRRTSIATPGNVETLRIVHEIIGKDPQQKITDCLWAKAREVYNETGVLSILNVGVSWKAQKTISDEAVEVVELYIQQAMDKAFQEFKDEIAPLSSVEGIQTLCKSRRPAYSATQNYDRAVNKSPEKPYVFWVNVRLTFSPSITR